MKLYFELLCFSLKNLNIFIFLNLRFLIIPFKKYLKEVHGKNILDFGCGHGLFSIYLSRYIKGILIHSYDIDNQRIKVLNSFVNNNFINNIKTVNDLILIKDYKFDTVLVVGVLSLLDDNEVIKIMNDLKFFLNKDSKIIISEILKNNSLTFKFHIFREKILKKINFTKGTTIKPRTKEDWHELFELSGFKIHKTLNINIFLHSTIDLSLKQ